MRSTLLLLALLLAGAAPARAQDFRVLRDSRPVDPDAKPPVAPLDAASQQPRVLLAGDSWAQYMWDDGSHNDLFDRFGHQDKTALSLSLDADPGPGYAGPEYSISGSEARQWTDTAGYPWIANMTAALRANPSVDLVVLSIGGNDVLAGKSDGGWYKDMDLDAPGSEAALFDRIRTDTFAIVDSALAVRPGIEVVLSSYDYPNFNVGFWCFLYACPKRRDLSRDPVNDLITDQELNAMMVTVEGRRIAWTNAEPRLRYDHAVGLMHFAYGDGIASPGTLPYPGQDPPDYVPFPGGNPLRPTLRSNFRTPNGIDADPIHLDYEGYQQKIANQVQTTFFPAFRGDATATFFSRGGSEDGWSDGVASGTDGIRVGRGANGAVCGILSFDTSAIPDGAVLTGASVYLHRSALSGVNPFTGGALGLPQVDVVSGSFGAPAVEASDAFATADAMDAGSVIGSARANGYTVRIELDAAALGAVDATGTTQFRLRFPSAGAGAGDAVRFHDGDETTPLSYPVPTLAGYMGNAAPFLDVSYNVPTGVGDDLHAGAAPRLLQNSPNPFRPSTTIPFVLAAPGHVRLRVFDVSGRLVAVLRDGTFPAGHHSAVWDGRDDRGVSLPSGIYFARLEAGNRSSTVRMVRVAGD